jgi:hypothetical protein
MEKDRKKKSLGEMMGWSKNPLERAKSGRKSQKRKKASGYGKKKEGEKSYFGL